MNLDLSALDISDEAPVIDGAGTVKRAPLSKFKPDPRQLARERDEEADNRDREDIRTRGVLSPLIVDQPDEDGNLPILIGHRRWRLSGEAGLDDAPYIFGIPGVHYDGYTKLAENRNRKDASPLDIAEEIVEGKARGEKHKFIADRIGIDPAEITHHLVLIEGPDYIRALYTEKKCRTPKYLYELSNIAKDFPEEVKEFCATSESFAWKTIVAFRDSLRNLGNTKEIAAPSSSDAPQPAQALTVTQADKAASGDSTAQEQAQPLPPTAIEKHGTSDTDMKHGADTSIRDTASDDALSQHSGEQANGQHGEAPATAHIPSHNPDIEKDADRILADPSKIKKPLLLGNYQGQDVMVNLYKRPSTPGMVFVKYENGNGEVEVEFGQVTNLTLTESRI